MVTADSGLYPLRRPPGAQPVAARFDEGAAVFARGEAAYEQGWYREAAELFLEAAAVLVLGGRDSDVFAAGRTASYWNAILANVAAGDRAAARRVGKVVEEIDLECYRSVAELLSRLGLIAGG